MPFRIEHGSLKNIGQLSQKAGESTARAKQDEMSQQFTFQKALQSQEVQNQMRLLAYRQELDLQASKMAQDWEVQKAMLNSQAEFKRTQMLLDAEYQQMATKILQKREEFENQVKALDKAKSEGWINQQEYQSKMLELQTGLRSGQNQSALAQMMGGSTPSMYDTLSSQQEPKQPDMMVNGVPYYQNETGEVIEGTPPETARYQRLQELASQSAYTEQKHKWGWVPGISDTRPTANIPVMKANLELALDNPKLSPQAKQELMAVIESGDAKAIEDYYKKLQELNL